MKTEGATYITSHYFLKLGLNIEKKMIEEN